MVNRLFVSLGLILSLLVVFATSSQVSADPAYNITDSTKLYNTEYCIFPGLAQPIDPKIACTDDGSNCIALVYDQCFTNGVRILWSVDRFETHNQVVGTMGGTAGSRLLDWYAINGSSMPYDVEYFPAQQVFYMILFDNVYAAFTADIDGGGPAAALPTVYSPAFPLVTPTQTFGQVLNIDCAAHAIWPKDWAGLGYNCWTENPLGMKFQDGNATNLWGIQTCQATDGADEDGLTCEFIWDVTNTTGNTSWYSVIDSTQSCSAATGYNLKNISINTFWSGNAWKYYVEANIDYCTGTINRYFIEDTLPTPQNYWNQHFTGGSLYFRNTTGNISGQILKSATSDFVSFGTPSVVYTEDSSINETINQSDSDVITDAVFTVWERKTNGSDESNNGIWLSAETSYQINVLASQANPVSINLWCNNSGEDYYDSGSGDIFTLNTPCQTGNQLIFTSGSVPSTSIQWVDVPSECISTGLGVAVLYPSTPSNHTFTVRAQNNNIALPNVNVTVGSVTQLTDVNGQTWFDIQPITSASLERVNLSACDIRYSTNGTGTSTLFTADRVGFLDEVGTVPAPVKTYVAEFGFNNWVFDTDTEIYMRESGMFWNLDIKASSGISLEPCNYQVMLSGPDVIQVIDLAGVPRVGNETTEFPATFKFNHSSSPVNVTALLTLSDGSQQYLYRNFTFDEEENDTFFIPFNIDTLPCISAASCVYVDSTIHFDCPTSVCLNEFFYKASPSICDINATCDYSIESCFIAEFCDDLVGCFDVSTTESCLQDADCQNSCANNNTLIWGKCGADDLCKNVTTPCTTGCNSTLDESMCNELASCELGDTFVAKVYYYEGSLESGVSQQNLLSAQATCDISSVGETVCLNPSTGGLPKSQLVFLGKTIDDLYITPVDWQYVDTGDYYNFSAISVNCNSTCDAVYTVCSGNCDVETGECVAGSSIQRDLFNTLPNWLQWLMAPMFLWTILALILGAILTFIPSKISQNAQPTPEIGLAGMFVWFIIGLGLQFVDPLIGILILIGLGLALAKMLSGMLGG